jgi:hypothetical protein
MGYSLKECRRDAAALVKTGSIRGDAKGAGARLKIFLDASRLAL